MFCSRRVQRRQQSGRANRTHTGSADHLLHGVGKNSGQLDDADFTVVEILK